MIELTNSVFDTNYKLYKYKDIYYIVSKELYYSNSPSSTYKGIDERTKIQMTSDFINIYDTKNNKMPYESKELQLNNVLGLDRKNNVDNKNIIKVMDSIESRISKLKGKDVNLIEVACKHYDEFTIYEAELKIPPQTILQEYEEVSYQYFMEFYKRYTMIEIDKVCND